MEPKEPSGPPELPKGTKFQPLSSVQPKIPSLEDDDSEEDHLNEHVENPGDPDGIIEAEQRRDWQMKQAKAQAAALTAAERPAKKRSKARWLLFPVVLLLTGAATYGAYWLGNHQADKNHHTTAQTGSQTTHHTQQSTQSSIATVPTKHYDSTIYTMGFDYPQDWTVSDSSAKLVVTSPKLSLTTASGSSVDGHVVVTIQNPQTSIPGYPQNGATAVRISDKLTYKQPTPVQRAQTYVSYLSYAKPNGLDAVYVTGDSGYQKGQNVPLSDVIKGNPLIGITFQSCTSADCSTGTPTLLTLSNDFWTDLPANKQISELVKSIQLN